MAYYGPVPTGYDQTTFTNTGRLALPGSSLAKASTAQQQGMAPIFAAGSAPGHFAGGGGSYPTAGSGPIQQPTQQSQQVSQPTFDPYAQLRGEISSGWDSYIGSLDKILNEGLPSQQTAQQGIVQSQYGQGVADLGAQKAEGLTELGRTRAKTEQNQVRTLRDLSGNIRNAFQAGNVYLGARGAGDSSAANQYSYALTKLGSQQRSDIMQQGADIFGEIDAREFKLGNIYNQEVNRLGSDRDQKLLGIQSWFAEQQNGIRQAQAQGQLGKSQDLASLSRSLLDQGLAQINFINQEAANKRAALDSWAMSSSQNINQLRTNMQGVQQFSPTQPQARQIAGTPITDASGGFRVPSYGGYANEDERNRLFA